MYCESRLNKLHNDLICTTNLFPKIYNNNMISLHRDFVWASNKSTQNRPIYRPLGHPDLYQFHKHQLIKNN